MGPFVSPQVSYVNELEASKALGSLQAWVEHNPKYHGLQVEADEYGDPASLMDGVLQLMQRAASHSPDPDVQVVRLRRFTSKRVIGRLDQKKYRRASMEEEKKKKWEGRELRGSALRRTQGLYFILFLPGCLTMPASRRPCRCSASSTT